MPIISGNANSKKQAFLETKIPKIED